VSDFRLFVVFQEPSIMAGLQTTIEHSKHSDASGDQMSQLLHIISSWQRPTKVTARAQRVKSKILVVQTKFATG
jgi:hypothetical protein